jgi:large subunit ribosomal protein L4e
MVNAPVYNLEGKEEKEVEIPQMFLNEVKTELIRRAAVAENTYNLQPQGHYVLAGMQTTATYYGAMNSYRTGRHMGIAIRPREKLGGGRQGSVKRIPSAVKGKRAHPHMIGKKITERMNKKEYQSAIECSIAASGKGSGKKPIIVSNSIEEVKRTKDMLKIFEKLNLGTSIREGKSKHLRKGLRRSSNSRHYKKQLLLVVKDDKGAMKAARNIPGVDACTLAMLNVNALAPGGNPGRTVVWSESAVKNSESAIRQMSIRVQSRYCK